MDLENLVVRVLADYSQFNAAMATVEQTFGRAGRKMLSDAVAIAAGTSKHFESVRVEVARVTQALKDLQNQMTSTANTSARTGDGSGRISLPVIGGDGGPSEAQILNMMRRDIRAGNRVENDVERAAARAAERDRRMQNRLELRAERERERAIKAAEAAAKKDEETLNRNVRRLTTRDAVAEARQAARRQQLSEKDENTLAANVRKFVGRDVIAEDRFRKRQAAEAQRAAEEAQKMFDSAGKATYEARFKAAKAGQRMAQKEADELQRLYDAAGKATYEARFRAAKAGQKAAEREAAELQRLYDAAGKASYEARFRAARAAQRAAAAAVTRDRRMQGRVLRGQETRRRQSLRANRAAFDRAGRRAEAERRGRLQATAAADRRRNIVSSLVGGMVGRLGGGAPGGIGGALGGLAGGPLGALVGGGLGIALKLGIDAAVFSAETLLSTLERVAGVAERVASWAIRVGMEYEKASVAFNVFAGGPEKGGAMLKQIQQLAVATPFKSNELQLSAQQLMSFGVGTEEVMPALGKLTAISMGDLNRLNHLIKAYGDVVAHGRFLATELRQFSNAGVGPADFARANNMTEAEFLARMHRGEATDNMMRRGVNFAATQGRFAGVNTALNNTVGGQINALVESVEMRVGKLMTDVFGKLDVSGKINSIVGAINSIDMGQAVAWFEKFSNIANMAWEVIKAIVVSIIEFSTESAKSVATWEEIGKKMMVVAFRVLPAIATFGQTIGKVMIDLTRVVVQAMGVIGAVIVDANNLAVRLGLVDGEVQDRNAPLIAAAGVVKGLDAAGGLLQGPDAGKILEKNLRKAFTTGITLPGAGKADTGLPPAAAADIKLRDELFGNKAVEFSQKFKKHLEEGLTPLQKFEEQMKIIQAASTVPNNAPAGTLPLLTKDQANLAFADAFRNLTSSAEVKGLTEARLAPAGKVNSQEARDIANQAGMMNEQIRIAQDQLVQLQQIKVAAAAQAAETMKLGKALADFAANGGGKGQNVVGVGFGPDK